MERRNRERFDRSPCFKNMKLTYIIAAIVLVCAAALMIFFYTRQKKPVKAHCLAVCPACFLCLLQDLPFLWPAAPAPQCVFRLPGCHIGTSGNYCALPSSIVIMAQNSCSVFVIVPKAQPFRMTALYFSIKCAKLKKKEKTGEER